MLKTCFIFWLSLVAAMNCGAAVSQDVQPHITVLHPGFDALTADLLSLTALTSPDEQEYGAELEAFIQDISIGMDMSRPIRVDVLTGSGPVNYLVWIPHENQDDFLENLDSLSFPAFQQRGQPAFYLLDDGIDKGWLRFQSQPKYAVLALSAPETHDVTKQQVLTARTPEKTFLDLGKLNASALLKLSNSQVDDDSQSDRRKSFIEIRRDEIAALVQRPQETTSEFELRKGTWSIIYDELQRIYVEAGSVRIWSGLDRNNAKASVSFDASGIESTSLADSIAEFGLIPDAFAGIRPLAGTVLSGRLNHPVDSLRQQNASIYLDLLTVVIHNRIDRLTTLQNAEKEATRIIFDDVVGIFRDGFASGNVNGFVEATHNGTTFTIVGAVSAPDSARLTETLKKLPSARSGNTVTLEFAVADDITIHKISLAKGFIKASDELFGIGREFLIGIGREQVWLATGPGSAALLESKIGEASGTEASPVALSAEIRLAPWIKRLYELTESGEQPAAVEERAAWRENLLRIEQLSESLNTDDGLKLSVTSVKDELSGVFRLNKGLLRFLGRQIARLTKENLEF